MKQEVVKQIDVHHRAPLLRGKFSDPFRKDFIAHIHSDSDCPAVSQRGKAFSSLDRLFLVQRRHNNATSLFGKALANRPPQSLRRLSPTRSDPVKPYLS
jgi:hypothetical protein